MRRVEPYDAPAPAEARDRELLRIAAVVRRPSGRGIEIRHHLRIGDPGDDGTDLLDVRELRDVALARVEIGRDRHVARLGEAARDVLDVLVHAEDFLHHEDDRKALPAGGPRMVGRHLPVLHGNSRFARLEPLRVGRDLRLGDRLDRGGETGGERAHRANYRAAAAGA